MRSYLDHNATSPLRPSVKVAMLAAMEKGGNASSVHAEGRTARKVMDDAREAIAFRLGCLPQMLTFTSGGTEANNMALRGVAVERLLVSSIEHPSVLEAAKASGKKIELIPVDAEGRVDIAALEKLLVGPKALVSIMLANNETGVIQNIAGIAPRVAKAGHFLHVDAVQGFGKMPVNFGLLGCDLLSIGAHKVGGPVGVGALVIRDGLVVEPLLQGGGQELRRRAGTENAPAIAGFAAIAVEPILDMIPLRDKLERELDGTHIFSAGAERLSNTICFSLPGLKAETLLMKFDLEGVAISSGSACSSGKVQRSHVLEAMGVAPDLAQSAIRVSLGWNSTAEDIAHFITVTNKIKKKTEAKAA